MTNEREAARYFIMNIIFRKTMIVIAEKRIKQ